MIAEVGAGLAVAATLMGGRPYRFETILENAENGAPSFLAPHQIVLLTPVKLETEACLWMGSVTSCHQEVNAWRTTVQIEHILRNLPDLLKLAARFE